MRVPHVTSPPYSVHSDAVGRVRAACRLVTCPPLLHITPHPLITSRPGTPPPPPPLSLDAHLLTFDCRHFRAAFDNDLFQYPSDWICSCRIEKAEVLRFSNVAIFPYDICFFVFGIGILDTGSTSVPDAGNHWYRFVGVWVGFAISHVVYVGVAWREMCGLVVVRASPCAILPGDQQLPRVLFVSFALLAMRSRFSIIFCNWCNYKILLHQTSIFLYHC